ncbi:MAG: methionyl-tRNA formyltransferase [Bacteroidetes bacterium]|nr:methionyl-tRNA formyltransferase [Bacteroidota bacterium]MDA0902788.1 methionyl-tRNA formyltransferase [Bacteroidota bacterium]MDA1243064.1 methionyl-tRNA formyltransferase [Bacteroidota bacterium]
MFDSSSGRSLRIAFMGTPAFAATCLERLLMSRHKVVGVVTAPDRPAGRGQTLRASEVKEVALRHHLPMAQPHRLRDPAFLEQLASWEPDLGVVVAFRMLPEAVWSFPPMGTINLHGSLLPQYRGAAPIHWAVIHGATVTGATTFLLQHEIDTGDLLGRVEVPIGPLDTTGIVHDRVLEAGKELLVETLDSLADGKAATMPQERLVNSGMELRHAPKLFKEDGRIQWRRSAKEIHNLVRGLNPYPGAWTTLPDGSTLRIHESRPSDVNFASPPGTVHTHKGQASVQCLDGCIDLIRVQPQGKPVMSIDSYLNGLREPLRTLGE